MADAAASAREQQGAPRCIGGRHGNPRSSLEVTESGVTDYEIKVTDRAGSSTRLDPAHRGGIRYDRANGTGGRARTRLARRDAPAAPARRPRYLTDDVFGGNLGDCLFKGEAAFQRLRLLARPGADLGLLRPGREIGVGLGVRHRRHVAADAHLPAQRLPMK